MSKPEDLNMEGAVAASITIPKQPNSKIKPDANIEISVESSPQPHTVPLNIQPTETADITVQAPLNQQPSEDEEYEDGQFIIDVSDKGGPTITLTVIVSMVPPDKQELDHVGNFTLIASPTTTMKAVKKRIFDQLNIRYEDMALVFQGKFLGDNRSFEYYFIKNDKTIHMLVETPNEVFNGIYETFKQSGLTEAKAWGKTHKFVQILRAKYGYIVNYNKPNITIEQVQYELDNLQIPETDESDVSDDSTDEEDETSSDKEDEDYDEKDEDSIDDFEYPPSVFHIGELETLMMNEELGLSELPEIIIEDYLKTHEYHLHAADSYDSDSYTEDDDSGDAIYAD